MNRFHLITKFILFNSEEEKIHSHVTIMFFLKNPANNRSANRRVNSGMHQDHRVNALAVESPSHNDGKLRKNWPC